MKNTPQPNLLPNCCNVGILFRILLAINLVFLFASISVYSPLQESVIKFFELAFFIEPITLTSAFFICLIRNSKFIVYTKPWLQRIITPLLCAGTTYLFLHFFEFLLFEFSIQTAQQKFIAIASAALLGFIAQHYFEIRSIAYSPSLAKAQLQALQTRIRPHFLFNSLNATLALIRHEPRKAEQVLLDLSDLFRIVLHNTTGLNSLENEIQLAKQYIHIETLRLGERLKLEWQIEVTDHLLTTIEVPVLLLQPLVENAIYYGVEPSEEPSPIKIRIWLSTNKLRVNIKNPFKSEAQTTHGNQITLPNLEQRLRILYDVEAQLTVNSSSEGIFEVQVSLPY